MKIVPRVISPALDLPLARPVVGQAEPPAQDVFRAGHSIPQSTVAPQRETITPPDFSGNRQQMVGKISQHVLSQPCITEGLDQAYSPNHPNGMTTRVHIEHQIKMVNHYVGAETAAVNALQAGDYGALHAMVDNPDAPEKLRISAADVQTLLEPLSQGLTDSDWKVLTVVAGYHDLGKMSPEWAAQSGLDLQGVEWIAHDFDSETMLRNNKGLLEPYGLNDEEKEKALNLCRLHSLPGQYFFGEGNVSAYGPLFKTAETDHSENVLKLARVHGILDVMSALNHKLVKPVLDSHMKLRDFMTDAYENKTPLGMKFRQTAVHDLQKAAEGEDGPALNAIQRDFGMGPVALQRLQKLVGNDVKPHHILKALENVGPEIAYEFHEATDREQTWFGTYIANSFGSGMAKALKVGKPDALAQPHEVAEATLKMIACSSRYCRRLQGVRPEWALGALQPSLAVAGGGEGALAVLKETQKIVSPDQGITLLTGPSSRLTMRGGETGVELGWR